MKTKEAPMRLAPSRAPPSSAAAWGAGPMPTLTPLCCQAAALSHGALHTFPRV